MHTLRNALMVTVAGTLSIASSLAAAQAPAASAPTAAPTTAPAAAPCPTPAESQRVAEVYAKAPVAAPFANAGKLKLAEVVVAGALPAGMGVGVPGSAFRTVWDSLATWDSAVVLIMKGGNVFEISSQIAKGEPSTRSAYFNLGKASLSGHLRPDLITAIHAVKLPQKDSSMRGVLFFDDTGSSVFGVFVPGEGAEPAAAQLAQFDRTWKLMESMPKRCAR